MDRVVLAFLILTCPILQASPQDQGSLRIKVVDSTNQPVAEATVTVAIKDQTLGVGTTDHEGTAAITRLPQGQLRVSVAKKGFQTANSAAVIDAGSALELVIPLLPQIQDRQTLTVTAQDDSALDKGSSPGESREREQMKGMPDKPATLAEALPTIPGVVRGPNGELSIAGETEQHNALTVNSIDTTDPATGEFGLTIPVDSIQVLNVAATPYLTQYGGFTATVVSAVTRPGGDKWSFELNDPFPEFRIRSLHLQGLRSATPRFTLGGPLLRQRLYFSESAEFSLHKTEVITLAFPFNESRTTAVNSFSHLDYVFSPEHTLTATLHVAPYSTRFANLDFFNPQAVTPNFSLDGMGAALIDRKAAWGGVFQTTLAWQNFTAGVTPQAGGEMIITPIGNRGSYFDSQARHSLRVQWSANLALKQVRLGGTHEIQFGTSLAPTEDRGRFSARPVSVEDASGVLLRQITFSGGARFTEKDLEAGIYGQDHWGLNSRLALDLGIRAERQGITETNKLAPRAGFVFSPFGRKVHTVFRGGAGVFYDHVPLNVYAFAQYPQQTVTTFSPLSGLPASSQFFVNELGAGHTLSWLGASEMQPGNFAPYSIASSLELEQAVGRLVMLDAKYTYRNSSGLVTVTPEPSNGENALVAQGNGRSQYRALELAARIGANTRRKLFISYVHSSAQGNLNVANGYLGNFPFPVVRNDQFATLPADVPNRVLVWGETGLPWKLKVTPLAEFRTGFPFAVTNALQDYVGVPNQNRFPSFFSLDARLSRDFQLSRKYGLRLSVRGLNLTNHFNPIAVHANTGDPLFGTFFGVYKRQFKLDFDVLF